MTVGGCYSCPIGNGNRPHIKNAAYGVSTPADVLSGFGRFVDEADLLLPGTLEARLIMVAGVDRSELSLRLSPRPLCHLLIPLGFSCLPTGR